MWQKLLLDINKHLRFVLAAALLFQVSCGDNLLGSLSNKDSDEALFHDALALMNKQDYEAAIEKILSTSEDFRSRPHVRNKLAGAYAGKCGLSSLFQFIQSLTGTTSDSSFEVLMKAFQSTNPSLSDCLTSEGIMKSFGNAAQRTSDQNLFFAIFGFAKIGLHLRNFADTDGNGTVDAGFDSCSNASISDAAIQQVFTGLGIALENMVTFLSSIASSQVGTEILDIQATCDAALGAGACDITDTSLVTPPMIQAMRSFLKSSDFGIENCPLTGAAVLGCCP